MTDKRIPIETDLPCLDRLDVEWNGRHFSLPYFYREGTGVPSIRFVHGLDGATPPALADCTLVTFDWPGTCLAKFDPEVALNVSALLVRTKRSQETYGMKAKHDSSLFKFHCSTLFPTR